MNTNELDCATARMYLSTRHDGEDTGDPSSAESLALHVSDCDDCLAFENLLAGQSPLFDSLRELSAPPALAGAIRARANSRGTITPHRARARAHRPTPLLLRAAAALIGFASIFAMGRNEQRAAISGDGDFTLNPFALAGRAFLQPVDFRALPERELLLHVSHGTGEQR